MKEEIYSMKSKAIKNSFWNFLMVFLGKIGALIFIVILARFLLPEKFGIYSLAISITLILITFADIGINQALIKYLSESIAKKDPRKTLATYTYLFKLKLFLTISFSALLLILSYPLSIYIFKKPDLFYPLLLASLYLFLYSIESFYASIFYVIEKVSYLTLRQFLWESLRIIGALAIFIFLLKGSQILGIIGVLIISMCITLSFFIYHLRKLTPFLFQPSPDKLSKEDKTKINKILFYLSIGGALTIIFGYIDVVMIGIFLPASSIGFYSAAMALSMGLGALLSISNVLLPVFTQLKKDEFNHLFDRIFRYTSLLAIPLICGLFIFGNYIIRTIYGYEYLSATLPLYFLAFLILEMPITNSLKSIFTAREMPKYFVNIMVISTLMNIFLNYFLITFFLNFSLNWAIAGAAMATLISRYFYFIGLSFYANKKLGIFLKYKNLAKPIFASGVMVLVLFWINLNISEMTFFLGLFEVFLGATIYFLALFIVKGISKKDFYLVKEIIK